MQDVKDGGCDRESFVTTVCPFAHVTREFLESREVVSTVKRKTRWGVAIPRVAETCISSV